jgi:purine-nucleoside phosphorylase
LADIEADIAEAFLRTAAPLAAEDIAEAFLRAVAQVATGWLVAAAGM